jgi:predicted ferric reductase
MATLAVVLIVVTTVLRERLGLSYEWWRRLHLFMAVGAVVAILIHLLDVSGYAQAAPMRYLLFLYAGAFGAITLNYRVIGPVKMRRRPWEITDNRDEGASTRTLRVRPTGHDGFNFEPGQFAWLVTGATPLVVATASAVDLLVSRACGRPQLGIFDLCPRCGCCSR